MPMRAYADSSHDVGLLAERRARWFLRWRGFRILESRYITGRRTGRAEIDIIARRSNLLIFCEVKNRPSIELALDAVTPAQSVRLRRAAENYIARAGWRGCARFDMIAVCAGRVYWVKNVI
jgi:putative endonuclease